jgi:hypothetical protein
MVGHLRQPHQFAKIAARRRARDQQIGYRAPLAANRPGASINVQPKTQLIGANQTAPGQFAQQRLAVDQPAVGRAGGQNQVIDRQGNALARARQVAQRTRRLPAPSAVRPAPAGSSRWRCSSTSATCGAMR